MFSQLQRMRVFCSRRKIYKVHVKRVILHSFPLKQKETCQKQHILNEFSSGVSLYFSHVFPSSFILFATFAFIFY
jgi:hypothetical protein